MLYIYTGMTNCSLETASVASSSGAQAVFDPRSPSGSYVLKLSNPYDWAVAYELFRAAALHPSCEVTAFT
jgi:hypothetical protein